MRAAKNILIASRRNRPHRYWRIYITAVNGSASSIAALLEVQMHSTKYGANLCTGGTASASSALTNLAASEAFDFSLRDLSAATTQDMWASSTGGLPHWLQYDFGAGNAKNIVALGVHARSDNTQAPNTFFVQYSDNGTDWRTLWAENAQTWQAFQFKRFTRPNVAPSYSGSPHGKHLYWRVEITRAEDPQLPPMFAELQFRATPGGADQASGGTASADAVFGAGMEADKAFDDNTATFWASTDKGTVTWGWITYQFASAVSVAEVAITARGDDEPDGAPSSFAVRYSDDGTLWTTAWSETGQTGWTLGGTRVFTDAAYRA